ncbi:MAG: C25 family cysteine peptidase [Planctomycetota bacterium]
MKSAKTKVVLAWILVVFLTATTQADPNDRDEPNWIEFIPSSTEGAPGRTMVKSSDNTGILVASEIPGMYVQDVNVGGERYQTVTIPGVGNIIAVGKPRLPVIKDFVEIPYFAEAAVEVFCSAYEEYSCYNVYPAQEILPDIDTNEIPSFVIDQTTYSTNEFYPSSIVEIGSAVTLRGHRIIPLYVSPIQFNPVTRKIRAYSSIEVRIEYDYPAQTRGIEMRLESNAFEDLCENVILNWKSPGAFVERMGVAGIDADPSGAEYLIITHDNFEDEVKFLTEWKRKKGYKAEDVNTTTAGTTAAQIGQYIQNAYDNWDPAPTYVLLVGDSEFIPTNYQTAHPYTRGHGGFQTATDLYYVTVDGNDYFPDMFIGRLSVDSVAEANTVINKILDYEKSPPGDPCFYNDVSVCAYFQDVQGAAGDGFEDRRYVLTSEEIRDYLLTQGYAVERIYSAENADTPTNYNNGDYGDGSAIPAELQRPTFAWDDNDIDITNAINAGRFNVYHRDHGNSRNYWRHHRSSFGSYDGWSHPSYTTADVPSLTNGNELPVLFSINCMTGWFDGEIDQNNDPALTNNFESLCEEFQTHSNGGSVAAIGASRVSYSGHNEDLVKGFYDAIWPDFLDPNQNAMYELGQILTYGKIYMFLQTWWGHEETQFELFHLFGDPMMTIRKQQPQSLTVTHSSEIDTGIPQIINVNVKSGGSPVNHARIGLYKPGDILKSGYTNVVGNATLTVTASTTGTLYITVTEVNSIPYEGTITVTNTPATITLVPDSGTVGSAFTINGTNFFAGETVNLDFGGTALAPATATVGGSFSAPHNVPAAPDGPTTVTATGQTSGKIATAVFTVIPAGPPPDPYIYSQWNPTTWHLNPNGSGPDNNPTWNNPCIQLYDDATGDPVASGNLEIGTPYRIDATIHNFSATPANDANVTFEWADLSTGSPSGGWGLIGTDTVDVPATPGTVVASRIWTPVQTGHCCIQVRIYHPSDANASNNLGWENTWVNSISSPAEMPFVVYNTTEEPAVVELELTQRDPCEPYLDQVWETYIERSCPQTLEPNEYQTAILDVNAPESAYMGQRRLLTVTARVNGEVIGGIEFEVVKGPPVRAYDPTPANGADGVPATISLGWESGVYTDYHDVYMGTDETAVREANEYSDEYKDPVAVPTYAPPGYLDFGQTYYWRIDEVNPSNPNSPWKGDVWDFTVETGMAHTPYPSDGDADVEGTSVVLSWLPGHIAAEHDVYFGTSFYDVQSATTGTVGIYKGKQTETDYNATGLTFGNTYYWRIDDVNLAGPAPYVWPGDVWSFTTGFIIDDFESYADTNEMNAKWKTSYLPAIGCPGSATQGGASITLETTGDNGFMQLVYDNDGPNDWYSEARYQYAPSSGDWAIDDSKVLSISYKGAVNNNADPTYDRMYVMIMDTAGNKTGGGDGVPVLHPDPNAQKNTSWQEWNVELSDLNSPSVDLESVKYLIIGFGDRCNENGGGTPGGDGTVLIDDIRLYGQRCLPSITRPDGDLNYDCVVDESDLQMLAEEWLFYGCCRPDLNKNYIVEFSDFATLANNWLEEQLWP